MRTYQETTQRGFQTRLEEVEDRAESGSWERIRTKICAAQPRKFDGSTSCAVFRRQFKSVKQHNYWTPRKKATYLIAAVSRMAAHIPHGVPTGATYEEVTEATENRYRDHHMEKAFHSQPKKIQVTGESLQEFIAANDNLARRTHAELPEHLISKEAAHAFTDGIRGRDIKQQQPEPPPAPGNQRLGYYGGASPPPPKRNKETTDSWCSGSTGHLRKDCPHESDEEEHDRSWRRDDGRRRNAAASRLYRVKMPSGTYSRRTKYAGRNDPHICCQREGVGHIWRNCR
jgi:hypothetical protein